MKRMEGRRMEGVSAARTSTGTEDDSDIGDDDDEDGEEEEEEGDVEGEAVAFMKRANRRCKGEDTGDVGDRNDDEDTCEEEEDVAVNSLSEKSVTKVEYSGWRMEMTLFFAASMISTSCGERV